MKYIEPKVYQKSFTCPNCGVLSKQDWWYSTWNNQQHHSSESCALRVGTFQHCDESSLWVKDMMVFPDSGNAPTPNLDMPDSVLKLYREAASVHTKSPRGAAALLRLAIQVLCQELGESGKNINNDIKALVQKGLPPMVQESLDIVRVTGNDAVHPGQIDTDDPNTVANLFGLINVVVEYMISLPQQVRGMYEALPVDKIEGIKNRDNITHR